MKNNIIKAFQKKEKKKEKRNTQPILYRIIKILIICLEIFSALLLGFYVVGNYQQFQDSSQRIILNILLYSSIFTLLLTVPIIIENLIMIFSGENILRGLGSLLFMIISIVYCVICLIVSVVINFLAAGL